MSAVGEIPVAAFTTLFADTSSLVHMKQAHWILVLGAAGAVGGICWQQYQEQQQTLLRLRLLDATLQLENERASINAEGILKGIAVAVAENRNRASDQEVLRISKEIHQRTDQVIRAIQVERARLLTLSGDSQVSEKLHHKVEGYFDFISPFGDYRTLELETKLANEPALMHIDKSRRYTRLYLEKAQVADLMAALTQEESILRIHETAALSLQAQKVGRSWDGFFHVEPFATAESNTVSVGDKYVAKLFLTSAGGGRIVQMTANGKPIRVAPDGRGNVAFTVPPKAAKHGISKAYWEGTIRAYVQGHDTTFHLRVPYTVRLNPQ